MKQKSTQGSLPERLAALSELVRLRMLRVLELEELSVGEVSQVVQLPQSTVSRHLKVLGDGGWLVKRSEGTATLYRLLFDDLSPELRALWRTVREQMGETEVLGEDVRRLRAVLDERKTDSQTFFGRSGGEWDAIRDELFGVRFTAISLLSLIDPSWVVADIGCGTGNIAELLSPVARRVHAIDQSEAMLSAARRRLSDRSNVEFRAGGLEKLPLADGTADVCVCSLVLHHVEDPAPAVREMRRCLTASNGGGVALVVDMLRHDREAYRRTMGHRHLGFTSDEMRRLGAEAGFGRVSYRELAREPDAKGPGLFACVMRLDRDEDRERPDRKGMRV